MNFQYENNSTGTDEQINKKGIKYYDNLIEHIMFNNIQEINRQPIVLNELIKELKFEDLMEKNYLINKKMYEDMTFRMFKKFFKKITKNLSIDEKKTILFEKNKTYYDNSIHNFSDKVNLENKEIKQEYYDELDTEFKKKYEEEFGINPNDDSYSEFDRTQNMERYARNIVFWRKNMIDIDLNSDGKTIARYSFVSNAHSNIIKRIYARFNDKEQKQIKNFVEELLNDSKNIKKTKLKELMKSYSKNAIKLHNECLNEKCKALDPDSWIANQDKMRKAWEAFNLKLENNKVLKKIMLNNSYSNYMQFMYDTYPPGFGNKIAYHFNNGISCDGAEIFANLKDIDIKD